MADTLAPYEQGPCDLSNCDNATLIRAAKNNHVQEVELLLPLEEMPEDEKEKTTIMHAAEYNHTGTAKLLASYEKVMKDKTGRKVMRYTNCGTYQSIISIISEARGKALWLSE